MIIGKQNKRLIGRISVAPESIVDHDERIARNPDDSLYHMKSRCLRGIEYYQVIVARFSYGRKTVAGEGYFSSIYSLVHEEEISDEKRVFHTRRWNPESLKQH